MVLNRGAISNFRKVIMASTKAWILQKVLICFKTNTPETRNHFVECFSENFSDLSQKSLHKFDSRKNPYKVLKRDP